MLCRCATKLFSAMSQPCATMIWEITSTLSTFFLQVGRRQGLSEPLSLYQ